MNLFSTFDPTTGMLSLNWLSMTLIFMLPMPYWNTHSKIMMIIIKMNKMIMNEVIMHSKNTKMSILMITIFMFILANNIMGMLPYVFTAPSHLVISLSMSLTLWMAIMIFGWTNKTKHMLIHMVPTGTPYMLMPFMVLIESISNIIRPGSLAVRLSANMIAGHLLMSLLGNNFNENLTLLNFMIWMFIALMMFEMAVAFIQSYVFMTLSTLYYSEV